MQVVKTTLLSLFIFWFALLFFMPKEDLYFTLEQSLQTEDIIIQETKRETGLFTLKLKEAKVFYKGIEIASIDEIDFFTLLFYTTVEIKGLHFDDSLRTFVPGDIDNVLLVHSLVSPLSVSLTALGDFGLAEGKVDLRARKVRIDIVEAKAIQNIKAELKKDEKGLYYETSF